MIWFDVIVWVWFILSFFNQIQALFKKGQLQSKFTHYYDIIQIFRILQLRCRNIYVKISSKYCCISFVTLHLSHTVLSNCSSHNALVTLHLSHYICNFAFVTLHLLIWGSLMLLLSLLLIMLLLFSMLLLCLYLLLLLLIDLIVVIYAHLRFLKASTEFVWWGDL